MWETSISLELKENILLENEGSFKVKGRGCYRSFPWENLKCYTNLPKMLSVNIFIMSKVISKALGVR